ncbi:peptidoglycan DD-metalloendopeptidase family protein [Flavobacterium rhizosphaerae]|uniref:M23 family metallopeptidase n=1 Tax=Flavobacterium rhizosphaerae TaxID=3163298 RepID=A0ABW8YVV1_9FLAO
MKKNVIIYGLSALAVLLLVISCPGCSGIKAGVNKITDAFTNPTAREVYAREFDGNKNELAQWEAAYAAAQHDSLEIPLPYGEKGTFSPYRNFVYSYTINLQEGEVLEVAVDKDSLSQRVFIDAFQKRDADFELMESSKPGETSLSVPIKETGMYKVILQSEMAAATGFLITINKQPLFDFPVAGRGNADIGSFWGMERDGGKRRHEGIDIFAQRGTPVVAVTDGVIGYTGERGLGGRQVWLRTAVFGSSLYYAHLDSIAVTNGQRVTTGDTLGFVGNTGNARFTPPHLHFGIYKRGAVNPLPYVYKTGEVNKTGYPQSFTTASLSVKSRANLRQGPSTQTKVIDTLSANDTVALLGQHNDWLHIQTPGGQKAFLHKSLANKLE